MRRMLTLIGLAVCGYLILVAGLYLMQRQLLYLPDRSIPSRTASGVPEMSEVRLPTDDGLDLLAWHQPAAPGRATILYLHGNGGHIGYRGDRVRPFIDAGFGVLLVEYRGYGGNPGRPSEPGLMSDARAALAFLETAGAPPAATVLYGESLGSTVAVAMAAERAAGGEPVAALVLEAPLSSVSDVAAHHYPWVPVRWLLKDRFEAVARIAGVGAPVLIIHGEADDIVPIRYGRALFEAAREPKEAAWIRGAGHEDLAEFGLRRIVLEFLARQLPGHPAPLTRPVHVNTPPDAPANAQ
jgi:fermentation-respiration switch protein FrsA (DUF1100 family)